MIHPDTTRWADMIVPQAYLRDAANEVRRLHRARIDTDGAEFEFYSEMIAFWEGSVRFWTQFATRWDGVERRQAVDISPHGQSL